MGPSIFWGELEEKGNDPCFVLGWIFREVKEKWEKRFEDLPEYWALERVEDDAFGGAEREPKHWPMWSSLFPWFVWFVLVGTLASEIWRIRREMGCCRRRRDNHRGKEREKKLQSWRERERERSVLVFFVTMFFSWLRFDFLCWWTCQVVSLI